MCWGQRMISNNLSNLVKTGQLHEEPPDQNEFNGLLSAAKARLKDARIRSLSYASRFDLTYNAAHALALAALRHKGYRTDKRYLVFQCLPYTAELPAARARFFARCHDLRNLAIYEGHFEIDEQLLHELTIYSDELLEKITALEAFEQGK